MGGHFRGDTIVGAIMAVIVGGRPSQMLMAHQRAFYEEAERPPRKRQKTARGRKQRKVAAMRAWQRAQRSPWAHLQPEDIPG